jgi:hypothetical protein
VSVSYPNFDIKLAVMTNEFRRFCLYILIEINVCLNLVYDKSNSVAPKTTPKLSAKERDAIAKWIENLKQIANSAR